MCAVSGVSDTARPCYAISTPHSDPKWATYSLNRGYLSHTPCAQIFYTHIHTPISNIHTYTHLLPPLLAP